MKVQLVDGGKCKQTSVILRFGRLKTLRIKYKFQEVKVYFCWGRYEADFFCASQCLITECTERTFTDGEKGGVMSLSVSLYPRLPIMMKK